LTDTWKHGHDFYLLGTGLGTWDNSFASTLQYTNPPRRDVAMLPAPAAPAGGGPPSSGGWLVIAFLTDNPGAWLMHCHIVSSFSWIVELFTWGKTECWGAVSWCEI
jgi:FtsP/CotA-like multicopper oxidase with cupredoxin domain